MFRLKDYVRHNNNYTLAYNKKHNGYINAQICHNCNKCGDFRHFHTCANTPILNILDHGPELVSRFGYCDLFEFNEKHGGKMARISVIKRFVLLANGFNWER